MILARPWQPRREWRDTLLGFLVAPLTVPLLYLAAASAFGGYVSLDLALYIAQYAYAAALAGGLPAHVALSRLGWVSLHDYVVFGVLLGATAALITERAPLDFSMMVTAALSAVGGGTAAFVFHLLARPVRGRGAGGTSD